MDTPIRSSAPRRWSSPTGLSTRRRSRFGRLRDLLAAVSSPARIAHPRRTLLADPDQVRTRPVADAKPQMLHAHSFAASPQSPRAPLYARPMGEAREQVVPSPAEESQAWIIALRGPAGPREQALGELHALLLRAARFELSRRRSQLAQLAATDVEDLATQAADDALMAILGKLDSFRGTSRFTTWAYKFALLEAGVKARRRAWHGREISVDAEVWPQF